MSFALPESMREYIDARVRDGNYGNTSEYLRELIRHDQERQRAARLRDRISDGLSSGDGRAVTDEVIADLRGRAFVGDRSRPRGYGHWPRMISWSGPVTTEARAATKSAHGSSIRRSPHSTRYFVADDHIDVGRLLADAQNLPAILTDTEQG
jgi:antitoxin ParD1/3/4